MEVSTMLKEGGKWLQTASEPEEPLEMGQQPEDDGQAENSMVFQYRGITGKKDAILHRCDHM